MHGTSDYNKNNTFVLNGVLLDILNAHFRSWLMRGVAYLPTPCDVQSLYIVMVIDWSNSTQQSSSSEANNTTNIWWRNHPTFVASESLLLYPQVSGTGLYPEPEECSPHPPTLCIQHPV